MSNTEENTKVLNIPIKAILPNPYQPRRFFDLLSLGELSKSIKAFGIIQPLAVRRLCAGEYELVAGERRLRAAEIAGLTTVPAIVVDVSDNDSAMLALIENIQRKDLNFFEEGEAFYHLIVEHGLTQEQLSQKIGKKQSTIANKLRLLKLPAQLRQIILQNDLSERHARALLKLPERDRPQVLEYVVSRNLNIAETEKYVDDFICGKINHRTIDFKKINKSDYKIFLNTIKKALDLVRQAGVITKTKQIEHDDCFEYVIRISK